MTRTSRTNQTPGSLKVKIPNRVCSFHLVGWEDGLGGILSLEHEFINPHLVRKTQNRHSRFFDLALEPQALIWWSRVHTLWWLHSDADGRFAYDEQLNNRIPTLPAKQNYFPFENSRTAPGCCQPPPFRNSARRPKPPCRPWVSRYLQ